MKICKVCKGNMAITQRDVVHSIFGVLIEVKNAAIYTCDSCNEEEYVEAQKIDHAVRDGFRTNQLSVDYTP